MDLRYSESAINLIGEALASDEAASLRVVGNSMVPLIRKGDIVFVRVHSTDKLSLGDIVVFLRGGEYVTHRYLKDNGTTLFTKGDNSIFPDVLIDKQAILGQVYQINHQNSVRMLDGKKAKYIAIIIGLLSLTNANIMIFLDAVWIKLFGHRLNKYKIFFGRVISYPFRGLIRIVALLN
jgi:signal peptidase I